MKVFLLAIMAGLAAAPAAASPCGERIAALQKRFTAEVPTERPASVSSDLNGTATESTGALLHHQPSAGSVADAEKSADSPEAIRSAKFQVAIEEAHAADMSGDARTCEANADKAETLLAR